MLVAAAGDISQEMLSTQVATSNLVLDSDTDAVLTLGDTQYEVGTLEAFEKYFEPTWGRFKSRIYPVPGNHEYYTEGAAGYFGYFGAQAGDPHKGYYSFDLGSWHLVALNSSDGACTPVPCDETSEQVQWLVADLAANQKPCTLAFWHHPRFNSGTAHGDNTAMAPFWRVLYEAGADVVLNGHEHLYERFEPQNPDGALDETAGLREFIVGTGGRTLSGIGQRRPNSAVIEAGTFGVLRLALRSTSYGWDFLGVPPTTFSDTGHAQCHRADRAIAGDAHAPP